jgi:hypothetical protein
VNEERLTVTRRKTHFCDKAFVAENPGPAFPSAWTSRFQIEKEGRAQTTIAADKHALVQVAADDAFQKFLIAEVLPATAPDFMKSNEDGTLFRIYHIGSLEIRTTQEQDAQEIIAAVFSRRAPSWQLASGKHAKDLDRREAVVKAKVYVEAAEAEQTRPVAISKSSCHFYVVLDSDASRIIVTERLADGSVAWAVNSDKLEDRNSLAKLLFTIDCKNTTLEAIKNLQSKQSLRLPTATSKAYAKAIFEVITGRGFRGKWGGYVRRYTGNSSMATPPTFYSGRTSDYMTGIWGARRSITSKANPDNEAF